MIEIETTNYDSPIYCMMCGTQTTDAQGSVVKCPHLVYLGMDEGAEFSIYESVEDPEDDDEWEEYDAQLNEFRKNLDDEHICVHITIPAPSGATYCIIYNLGAIDEDSKKSNLNGDEMVKTSNETQEDCR
jgi:hypothetical protein